jgi:hypothetical protein
LPSYWMRGSMMAALYSPRRSLRRELDRALTNRSVNRSASGAGDGDRTRDPLLGRLICPRLCLTEPANSALGSS